MSISPTGAQTSVSTPPFTNSGQNPSTGHGLLPHLHGAGLLGPQINGCSSSSTPFGSSKGSSEQPPRGSSVEISGTLGCEEHLREFISGINNRSSHHTSDSSKNVNSKGSNARKHSRGQQSGAYSQHQLFGQKGSSQLRWNKLAPQPDAALATSATQATASRRREAMNANHLLNFHYDPIPRSRPQQRTPPPRRQQRVKPFNKGLFLQANYKFVIYDSGRYSVDSIDPDKMFPWEDIVCVVYSSPIPVQCPICLESPLCPQITSCGHIYCFPCILRYLLMGVEEHKSESWKKCPLCFSMISSKDLYTIKIEDVKQFRVGDRVEFALLSRAKDSLIPSLKIQDDLGLKPRSPNKMFDLFSRFILSSDIELSVRDAKSGLADWLCKAETSTVDDIEKLPYVCAALEQLEERMKNWVENRVLTGSPQPNHFMVSRSPKVIYNPNSSNPSSFNSNFYTEEYAQADALTVLDTWMVGSPENGQVHEKLEFSENFSSHSPPLTSSSSSELMHDQEKSLQKDTSSCKDFAERDSYTFYQAIDGQSLILHPLSMKCLLHYYRSYDMLPPRISGVILEFETITQSEATRKRYRYLSHFSLTTSFQLCEIDLTEILPPASLAPFMDEINKRETQRKQLVKMEREEKARTEAVHCAEVAALRESLNPTNQKYLSNKDTIFSLDEFEALGTGAAPSTNPAMNRERKLFSNVTRLGYAAAHDSPALRAEEFTNSSRCMDVNSTQEASGHQAIRATTTPSFANILSSSKNGGSADSPNSKTISRKGKKSNMVLLSTSGSRRY